MSPPALNKSFSRLGSFGNYTLHSETERQSQQQQQQQLIFKFQLSTQFQALHLPSTIWALSNTINGLHTTQMYPHTHTSIHIQYVSDPKSSVDKRPTINIYQAQLLAVRRRSRHEHDKNTAIRIHILVNNTHSQYHEYSHPPGMSTHAQRLPYANDFQL